MEVREVQDPGAYLERVTPFLLEDEARHNLAFRVVRTLIEQPGAYARHHLWLVEDGGEVAGAALMTPPYSLIVCRPATGDEDEVHEVLARALHEGPVPIPKVIGALPEVRRFADAWGDLTGAGTRLLLAERLYRLTSVRSGDLGEAPGGRMRDADTGDLPLMAAWMRAFQEEALPVVAPDADQVARRILESPNGGLVLWEDEGGEAVSLAGFGASTPSGALIGPVYTPPEQRGRGYASALVAGVSQRLLDEGMAFCSLFADVENPTSNRIYQRIGFDPLYDYEQYEFVQEGPELR